MTQGISSEVIQVTSYAHASPRRERGGAAAASSLWVALWAAWGQVRTGQSHLAIWEAADAGLHRVAWRDIQGRCDDSCGRGALREVHLPKGDGLACLRQARGRLSAHAHVQPVPHSPDSIPAGRQTEALAKGPGYSLWLWCSFTQAIARQQRSFCREFRCGDAFINALNVNQPTICLTASLHAARIPTLMCTTQCSAELEKMLA